MANDSTMDGMLVQLAKNWAQRDWSLVDCSSVVCSSAVSLLEKWYYMSILPWRELLVLIQGCLEEECNCRGYLVSSLFKWFGWDVIGSLSHYGGRCLPSMVRHPVGHNSWIWWVYQVSCCGLGHCWHGWHHTHRRHSDSSSVLLISGAQIMSSVLQY